MLEFLIPSENPINSPDIKQAFHYHKPEKEVLHNSVHIIIIVLNCLANNDNRVEERRQREEDVDDHLAEIELFVSLI